VRESCSQTLPITQGGGGGGGGSEETKGGIDPSKTENPLLSPTMNRQKSNDEKKSDGGGSGDGSLGSGGGGGGVSNQQGTGHSYLHSIGMSNLFYSGLYKFVILIYLYDFFSLFSSCRFFW